MNTDIHAIVVACSRGSEDATLSFPQILGRLALAGVEGFHADLRRSVKTYYLPSGESIEISCVRIEMPVAGDFDAGIVASAVRQSQAGTHTYHDF